MSSEIPLQVPAEATPEVAGPGQVAPPAAEAAEVTLRNPQGESGLEPAKPGDTEFKQRAGPGELDAAKPPRVEVPIRRELPGVALIGAQSEDVAASPGEPGQGSQTGAVTADQPAVRRGLASDQSVQTPVADKARVRERGQPVLAEPPRDSDHTDQRTGAEHSEPAHLNEASPARDQVSSDRRSVPRQGTPQAASADTVALHDEASGAGISMQRQDVVEKITKANDTTEGLPARTKLTTEPANATTSVSLEDTQVVTATSGSVKPGASDAGDTVGKRKVLSREEPTALRASAADGSGPGVGGVETARGEYEEDSNRLTLKSSNGEIKNLIDAGYTKRGKSASGFYIDPALPDTVYRYATGYGKSEVERFRNTAEKSVNTMTAEYGRLRSCNINVPYFETQLVEKLPSGDLLMLSGVDVVHGQNLIEYLRSNDLTPELQKKMEETFANMMRYIRETITGGHRYLSDTMVLEQYMIGSTAKDQRERLYMVDVTPEWWEDSGESVYKKGMRQIVSTIRVSEMLSGTRFDHTRTLLAREIEDIYTLLKGRLDDEGSERRQFLKSTHRQILEALKDSPLEDTSEPFREQDIQDLQVEAEPAHADMFAERQRMQREIVARMRAEGEKDWEYNSGDYKENEQMIISVLKERLRSSSGSGNPVIAVDLGGGAGLSWARIASEFRDEIKKGQMVFVVSNLTTSARKTSELRKADGEPLSKGEKAILKYAKEQFLLQSVDGEFNDLAGTGIILPNGRLIDLRGNVSLLHESRSLTAYSKIPEIEIPKIVKALAPHGVYLVRDSDNYDLQDVTSPKEEQARIAGIGSAHARLVDDGFSSLGSEEIFSILSSNFADPYIGFMGEQQLPTLESQMQSHDWEEFVASLPDRHTDEQLKEAIKAAISRAPIKERSYTGAAVQEGMQNYRDHDVIHGTEYGTQTITAFPNRVYFKTTEDFERALEIGMYLLNQAIKGEESGYLSAKDKSYVQRTRLYHEKSLEGESDFIFGLEFIKYGDSPEFDIITFNTIGRAMTKIEYAAYLAHLPEPSGGNIENLRRLGFNNIAEVTERIVLYNSTHRKQLPIPQSALGETQGNEVVWEMVQAKVAKNPVEQLVRQNPEMSRVWAQLRDRSPERIKAIKRRRNERERILGDIAYLQTTRAEVRFIGLTYQLKESESKLLTEIVDGIGEGNRETGNLWEKLVIELAASGDELVRDEILDYVRSQTLRDFASDFARLRIRRVRKAIETMNQGESAEAGQTAQEDNMPVVFDEETMATLENEYTKIRRQVRDPQIATPQLYVSVFEEPAENDYSLPSTIDVYNPTDDPKIQHLISLVVAGDEIARKNLEIPRGALKREYERKTAELQKLEREHPWRARIRDYEMQGLWSQMTSLLVGMRLLRPDLPFEAGKIPLSDLRLQPVEIGLPDRRARSKRALRASIRKHERAHETPQEIFNKELAETTTLAEENTRRLETGVGELLAQYIPAIQVMKTQIDNGNVLSVDGYRFGKFSPNRKWFQLRHPEIPTQVSWTNQNGDILLESSYTVYPSTPNDFDLRVHILPEHSDPDFSEPWLDLQERKGETTNLTLIWNNDEFNSQTLQTAFAQYPELTGLVSLAEQLRSDKDDYFQIEVVLSGAEPHHFGQAPFNVSLVVSNIERKTAIEERLEKELAAKEEAIKSPAPDIYNAWKLAKEIEKGDRDLAAMRDGRFHTVTYTFNPQTNSFEGVVANAQTQPDSIHAEDFISMCRELFAIVPTDTIPSTDQSSENIKIMALPTKPDNGDTRVEEATTLEDFDFSLLNAKTDPFALQNIEDLLERSLLKKSSAKGELARRINGLLPRHKHGIGPKKWENGLYPDSERFNHLYKYTINEILKRTSFFAPLQATGVIDWFKAGMTNKRLSNGLQITEQSKGSKTVYAYYPTTGNVVIGDWTTPTKLDVLDYLIGVPKDLSSAQRLAAHNLVFEHPEKKKKSNREILRHIAVPLALNEAFRRRTTMESAIDIRSATGLSFDMWEALSSKRRNRRITSQENTYAVSAIDQLTALYSIHPDIGMENAFQEIGKLLVKVGRNFHKWDAKAQQYPVIQEEIDKRARELGINSEDKMEELVERFKRVRNIQRHAAQYVAQQIMINATKDNPDASD